MTPAELTAAATRLGIRPTRAPVGSQVWECWADRVREAVMLIAQINDWNSRANVPYPDPREAIDEADRYAV